MATIAETATPNMSFTTYRLLSAVLAVAALASVAASVVFSVDLLVFSAEAAIAEPRSVAAIALGIVVLTAVASLVAFLFVFGALALIALPLTRWLVRLGLRPLARDLVLLAVAALIAVPLWFALSGDGSSAPWLFPTYDAAAAIIWIAALRRMERRDNAFGAASSARSAAVFD